MVGLVEKVLRVLYVSRYIHFFGVGLSAVALNLSVTVGLTELFFGREHYFSAYLIGLSVSVLYSFALHTVLTFKTSGKHGTRLVLYIAYSLSLAYVQAMTVRYITGIVGVDWYAPVIATVVMGYSLITFVIFKLFLFREVKPVSESVDIRPR